MDAQLVKRLLELNRVFYSRFSSDFSETRGSERLNIEPFAKYLASGIRLLDLGCGNGRLAQKLDRAGYELTYIGVDVTPELIAIADARREALKRVRAEFRVADIATRGWSDARAAYPPFDVAVALAVLHHIPSFALRREVLREIHALLKPRGIFVMSNWQFTRNERLRKKIVAWEKLEISAAGERGDWRLEISAAGERGDWRLEPGDALLDWKRGGVGYRYCHLFTERQVEQLAEQSGFEVIAQSYADAELNLFSILRSV